MRCEDREIDRADNAFAGKFCWTEAKIISAKSVIYDVAQQKKRRDRACREHTETMPRNLPLDYEVESRQQKDAAEGVQSRIYMREYL